MLDIHTIVKEIEFVTEQLLCALSCDEAFLFYGKPIFYFFITITASWLFNYITKRLISVIVVKLVRVSRNVFDDLLLEYKFFTRLSHIIPILVFYGFTRLLFHQYPWLLKVTLGVTNIYIVLAVLFLLFAFLNATEAYYNRLAISRTRPIKGVLQIVKIFFWIIAFILILSIILEKNPVYFLSGVGAASAILILIFKDTILNFIAGLQITSNNLIQLGDWIEMTKYGADGEVVEINLYTVLVRNFDNTITTVPAYAFMSDSFKNWRGMIQSGHRRIKRAIHIDARSIKICDDVMIEKFKKVHLLKDYIEERLKEIQQHNEQLAADTTVPVNGRRLTNIGVFRVYIEKYLEQNPYISKEMIYMCRQLAPTEKGVPLEVYAFVNQIQWKTYEQIQSDIFDHILSRISYFELKLFQDPTDVVVRIEQSNMKST